VWAARWAESQRRDTETSLVTLRGQIDQGLARLDATLQHQTFLLQRFADIELQGMVACWSRAVHSMHLLNGIRPLDSGTDRDALESRLAELTEAHNGLLSEYGKHDPFLHASVSQLLADITRLLRLELSQARREVFEPRWWDQGDTNRQRGEELRTSLRVAIQARVSELRRVAETR
jgi:hypothetical protein